MTNKEVIKTFTITTSNQELMDRLERFLALLHYNSSFGHSGLFGMPLDGDGSEKIKVSPITTSLAHEVDAIGGVGYNIEIAQNNGYAGKNIDRNYQNIYYTKPAGNLYRNGELIKTIPSYDDYDKMDCTKSNKLNDEQNT